MTGVIRLKKALCILVAFAVAFFITGALRFTATAIPYLSVHNVNTGLDYATIQEAINAPETLDGQTIRVDAGTYYENVVVNKALSLVGENRLNTVVDGNGTGTVFDLSVDSVSITGFTIRNAAGRGIYMFRSSGSNISYNTFLNSSYAIWLGGSTNTLITGNNLLQLKHVGIIVSDSSDITLSSNNVADNEFGIALIGSSNGVLRDNNVSSSSKDGVYFFSSDDNIIQSNTISSCNESGIWLSGSSNNLITGNDISLNNPDGIHMENSNGSIIFHNNLVNNTMSLVSINSTSSLDDGIEGNYWNDYNGKDEDQDGIGDTPCIIDGNNRDNHPLMGTFSEFTTTREAQTYHVDTVSNSTISDFGFNLMEYTINFNVTSPANNSGFCRIMIPEILVMGPYIALVDDKEVNATLLPVSNATHAFIYFAYILGTHEVTISSEPFYDLLKKYTSLLADIQDLNSTYNQLLSAYSGLLEDFGGLNQTYQELKVQYHNLNTTYNDVFGNYTELQHNHTSLQINYDTLSGQYYSLNSTYNSLLASYKGLESKWNTASSELAGIKNQMTIFTVTTITETIVVLVLILLGIKYYGMLNKQKKEIEAYKRQLEKISHLEGARTRFAEDVRKRKAKIEQFEKKYHVSIRPPSTLEEILESIKLKEKTAKEEA
jgi:parallel beta-helix repeat protein